jgi:predicted Fe-Mo cluster-binding NifX family protein
MTRFTRYRRKQIAELRPYVEGEDMSTVSIAQVDAEAGSPKAGDMIARNPKNHQDQWLVARQYFEDNFEALSAQSIRVRGGVASSDT